MTFVIAYSLTKEELVVNPAVLYCSVKRERGQKCVIWSPAAGTLASQMRE